MSSSFSGLLGLGGCIFQDADSVSTQASCTCHLGHVPGPQIERHLMACVQFAGRLGCIPGGAVAWWGPGGGQPDIPRLLSACHIWCGAAAQFQGQGRWPAQQCCERPTQQHLLCQARTAHLTPGTLTTMSITPSKVFFSSSSSSSSLFFFFFCLLLCMHKGMHEYTEETNSHASASHLGW